MSTQSDEIAPSLSRPPTNNNNARNNQKVKNTSNTDDDDASFLDLHSHIRVTILNYLGETQDELMALTLVSKQVYEDCKQPGIKWKIIPTIQLRPQQQGMMICALLLQLRDHHNIMDYENIRRYHHMKVNDVHKFIRSPNSFRLKNGNNTYKVTAIKVKNSPREYDLTEDFQLESILSLDMSLSMPMFVRTPIPIGLLNMLPNLREINLSNICTDTYPLNNVYLCPHLEKVTWNNITGNNSLWWFPLNGRYVMQSKNLKEIITDNSKFSEMSSIDNNRDGTFLFYRCSKALERVSIRNAKWINEVLPQNVLIKFVRNVPTLRWFRSDLTIENIKMLNLERPEIVLLN